MWRVGVNWDRQRNVTLVTMNYPDTNRYDDLSTTLVSAQVRENSLHPSEGVVPDKREQGREQPHQQRQRDTDNSTIGLMPGGTSDANLDSQDQGHTYPSSNATKKKGGGTRISLDNLPLKEAQRKQRVREAARERQRKHRASVKAKRMAELGMAIGMCMLLSGDSCQ
jgi:hypothetical protein